MKKVAFCAAVAAMCGGLLAVESANIVGYQQKAAEGDGLNWMVSTFLPVGKNADAVTISDLSVSDSWDPTSDTVQLLNGNGGTIGNYTYISAEIAADNGIESGAGWYDADKLQIEGEFVKTPNVSIPYGAGMAVAVADPTTALVFAGSVQKGAVALEMTAGGLNWTGNAMPVDMTIADLTVGDTWDPTSDTIQRLNGNGGTIGNYTYISAEIAADNGIKTGAGWYDADKLQIEGEFVFTNTISLPAGYAFAVTVANDGTTIILPKAID